MKNHMAWAGTIFLALMLSMSAVLGAGVRIVYPADAMPTDPRHHDVREILQLALEKTESEFGPFELVPSETAIPKARLLLELELSAKPLINIIWATTSDEMESRFLPIRIPLRKGLLGYRLLLIESNRQTRFDQVRTLDDLKQFTIGQGQGWGDSALYEANGITVFKSKYDNLFKMLQAGRFDMFPRGVGEIFAEYDLHVKDDPNLTIEKNLLLYYPWPYYFFFNKNDAALKNRIETGIRIMIKDGSFDAIFRKYNQKAIEKANLKGRRLIPIRNDGLPKETPLNDPALWFDPDRFKAK